LVQICDGIFRFKSARQTEADSLMLNLPPITLDMVLSDRLLLIGLSFLVFGLIVFLISAFKFFTFRNPDDDFALIQPAVDEPWTAAGPGVAEEPAPNDLSVGPIPKSETPEPAPVEKAAPEMPVVEPARPARVESAAERTVVMAPGTAEMQAQLEIALTQIRSLNQRLNQAEEALERQKGAPAQSVDESVLRGMPKNNEELVKKILTLAEHVIVLEREVAALKGGAPAEGTMPR
jgi:hypothetical protein